MQVAAQAHSVQPAQAAVVHMVQAAEVLAQLILGAVAEVAKVHLEV
jgi:hypothetical protein